MSAAEPATVVVRRPADAPRRALRDDRGISIAVAGADDASTLDIHVNEITSSVPGPYHRHDHADNFYYVLEGHGRIRIAGEDHLVGPGDALLIPRGVPHGVSLGGEGPLRLVEIYAPAGADFVEINDAQRMEGE